MEVKPGYKQTEVGVIPEDWEVDTLGELSKLPERHLAAVRPSHSEGQASFITKS